MITAFLYVVIYLYGSIRALLGKPMWGIYIYFMSFYMHAPTQYFGQFLPDLRWSLLAGFISLASLLLHKRDNWVFWRFNENILLSILFIVVLLQTPFAINIESNLEYVFLLLKFIFFIFLLQNTVQSTKDIKKIIIVNIIGCAYLAYLGLSTHTGGRLGDIGTSGMDGSNQLGQHLTAVLFMGAYLLLCKWRKEHLLLIIPGLALTLMAIFMTESRGVIMALFGAGAVGALLVPKMSGKRWLCLSALGFIGSISLMGPQIIERFESMGKDETGEVEDASARSRWVIIDAQKEMFEKSVFMGHGHQGTLFLSPTYIPPEYHANGVGARASHNVAMSFLVDHGLIGFTLYFLAIAIAFKKSLKVHSAIPEGPSKEEHHELRIMLAGTSLALIAFMLGGMFSDNKKLEADIWLLGLIPLIHYRIISIEKKSEMELRSCQAIMALDDTAQKH